MNPYENGVIKYAIDYERYKNGVANEIIRLLDNANIEMAGYIKKTQNVATKARYKQIAKKLREVSSALKEKAEQKIDADAVIKYELTKENKLFREIKKILKIDTSKVDFKFPTVEQIKTSALFRPVTDGLTFDSYLNGIEAGLFNTWDSAVRTGYLTGIPTKQIVSNVMGGVSQIDKLKKAGQIEPLRNAVYGNTRTLLQSFAEEARESVYRENEKYFGVGDDKYEYLATLDARTCLVCGNYDGKKFKSLEDAPHVPQHRNCRCLIIPYFDIKDDTRASKDGQVSSKIDFATWLEEQDEKTQKEVLGATRFRMYQEGVKFEQFVDNGQTLTLDQLYERGLLDSSAIKSSLSKSIDIDDFELMGDANGVKKEVIDEIYNVIHEYEKRGDIYISEFSFGKLKGDGNGTPLLQVEPISFKRIQLNVNTDVVAGKTVQEINERLKLTKDNLATTLKEATIHECGHAKLIKNLSLEEIEKLYAELSNKHISGISAIAYADGVEAIAEIEILLSRGVKLTKDKIDFYNKYVL